MEEMWLARDENGELYLYIDNVAPKKVSNEWAGRLRSTMIEIPKRHFREIKLSDAEPTKVKLEIMK